MNPLKPEKLTPNEFQKFWLDRNFAVDLSHAGVVTIPDVARKVFHTGPYFYIVDNYTTMKFVHVYGATAFLGFEPTCVAELIDVLHPDDKEKVLGLAVHYQKFLDEQSSTKRLDFWGSLNFRIRHAQGHYIHVLEQAIGLMQDSDGRLTHALKYFTNISHMPYSDEIILTILDNTEPENQHFYTFSIESTPSGLQAHSNFSTRELEILQMIAKGDSSKEIAVNLSISINTVNKHRENMMKKTKSKNINEVLSFAFCQNYI